VTELLQAQRQTLCVYSAIVLLDLVISRLDVGLEKVGAVLAEVAAAGHAREVVLRLADPNVLLVPGAAG